ncbi:Beta-glucosidase 42 (AtBGLU42) [Durusdinium trenchii]|uniref:Beta-glucosidase 42 (AtBGLU42) n=1 Tax=Durusdinium trenchii TaxID=1381693 RepID=A0ABP0SHV4_9DINO
MATADWALSRDLTTDDNQKEDLIREAFSDPSFMWGCATSAYQVEGAWNEDGRTPSIWDKFTHAGRAFKGSNGDQACDYYHRWQEDLDRVAQYGFNTYRFSISWTRVFPMDDQKNMYPNEKGIQFYKNILHYLSKKGIRPLVTMFHWDLPEKLDWLDEEVVDYFVEYADFLLTTFQEVDWWSTFNEPWTFCTMGYALGLHAPGKQSKYLQYQCGHNVLRAHARVVDLFRRRHFRMGMKIGLVLNYDFPFPKDPENPHDVDAVQADAVKGVGWFADPVYKGDYPELLKESLGEHLPKFTEEEKNLLLQGRACVGLTIGPGPEMVSFRRKD